MSQWDEGKDEENIEGLGRAQRSIRYDVVERLSHIPFSHMMMDG